MPADAEHVYTLLAYRPNGVDTCRGCVMGTSDSDFKVQVFTDTQALTEAWAQLLLESSQAAREVCSVEFTLLIDGLDYDGWWTLRGDAGAEEPPYAELERAATARESELRAEQIRVEQARRHALAVEQRRKARLAAVATAKAERAHYLALHTKYGPKGL